jgi:hypothetical protein
MAVEVVDAADCSIVNRARVRLSIDYGTASITAVLAFTGGHRVPVVFDGSPLLPSGVWIDPSNGRILTGAEAYEQARQDPACFVEYPKQCLADGRRIHRAGRDIDPVDLASAVLRRVADHARRIAGGPVVDVVLAVPAGWGPRRANLLREAASRAGLPVPALVPEPIAAACHLVATTATTVPAEGCVLVCDVGAGSADVSVVQRNNIGGWDMLSAITAPGAAGADLDDAVVRHLTAPDGSQPDLWQRLSHPATADAARDRLTLRGDARQAKEALSRTSRAAVALPAPHPPVVLDRDHLDTLARPLADRIAQAAGEAVAAADITAEQLAAVVLVGGAARAPHLPATLHDRFGITPVLLDPPALAVVEGSLHPTTAATAARPAAGTPTPVFAAGRPKLRQLAGILAPGVASLALLIQTLATAENYPNPGGTIPGVLVINGAEYAMAGLYAVLAVIAGARFVASTLLHEDIDAGTPGQRARHGGQILSGAAVAGMAAAGLYGLLGGALFGLPSSRFLTWTLLAPLPAAAVTVVTGLLAPRIRALTASPWADRLHHPVVPVTLAAVGMLLAQAALSAHLPWSTLVRYGPIAGPAGTGLLGVATALTAATRLWPRVGLSFLLGLGGAVVYNLPNTAILGAVYIIVVGAWWIVRVGRIAADAFPHARPTLRGWWTSLTGSPHLPHS